MDPFDRQLPVRRECHADGCDTSFEDNGRWTPERQPGSDWFTQRNGWTWCPDHTPDWVAEWRARRRQITQAKAQLQSWTDTANAAETMEDE